MLKNTIWSSLPGVMFQLSIGKRIGCYQASGIEYDGMKPSDMVVVDLDGNRIEGTYKPSSDTPTHLELYRHFLKLGRRTCPLTLGDNLRRRTIYLHLVQRMPIISMAPFLAQRDDYAGDYRAYEKETGSVIVETFQDKNPLAV